MCNENNCPTHLLYYKKLRGAKMYWEHFLGIFLSTFLDVSEPWCVRWSWTWAGLQKEYFFVF